MNTGGGYKRGQKEKNTQGRRKQAAIMVLKLVASMIQGFLEKGDNGEEKWQTPIFTKSLYSASQSVVGTPDSSQDSQVRSIFIILRHYLPFSPSFFPQLYSVSQRLCVWSKRLTRSRRITLSSIYCIRDLQNSENVQCLSSHKCFKDKFWKSYLYILKVITYKYFKDLFEREQVCAQQGEGQRERENLKQTVH